MIQAGKSVNRAKLTGWSLQKDRPIAMYVLIHMELSNPVGQLVQRIVLHIAHQQLRLCVRD